MDLDFNLDINFLGLVMIFWSPVQNTIRIQNTLLVVIFLIVLGVACRFRWEVGPTQDITMKKMVVAELKEELRKRGMDSTGTRATLIERLEQVMQREESEKLEEQYEDRAMAQEAEKLQAEAEEDGPPDGSEEDLPLGASTSSVQRDMKLSGQGSCSLRSGQSQISTASARALEAARRAGLEAKMKMMKQKHQLEEDEAKVKQRLEEERAKVQHKKEEMELRMELEESKAREDALKDFEVHQQNSVREQVHASRVVTEAQ